IRPIELARGPLEGRFKEPPKPGLSQACVLVLTRFEHREFGVSSQYDLNAAVAPALRLRSSVRHGQHPGAASHPDPSNPRRQGPTQLARQIEVHRQRPPLASELEKTGLAVLSRDIAVRMSHHQHMRHRLLSRISRQALLNLLRD